jgi:hypothetical protein
MGTFGTKGLAGAAVAAAIAVAAFGSGPGCSTSKPTELVPGVLTQVQVPRDLAAIRVDVEADGRLVFCSAYSVYDGVVRLPRTLGVVSATSPQTTVAVTIRGYDAAGTKGMDIGDCTTRLAVGASTPQAGPGPRTLRRSVQTFVDQHILFLPMPLSYSCFDQDCSGQSAEATCKGAQCVPTQIESRTLADFEPSLIDGTGLCFSPEECFQDARPAAVVDAGQCIYGFPEANAPGPGLNVRVFYEDFAWLQEHPGSSDPYEAVLVNAGEPEILNEDDVEGIRVLSNRQFQLAPGLCNLAKAASAPPTPPGTLKYRVISDVQVASACAPKSPLLPICAAEQDGRSKDGGIAGNLPDGGTTTSGTCNVAVPLSPAPSALYLVMDDSTVMHGAFGPMGYATAMGLSLAGPVFKNTYVGFRFLSHADSECTAATTAYATPGVDFDLAPAVQASIAAKLKTPSPPDAASATLAPLDLQAAMRLDAGAYATVLNLLPRHGLQGRRAPNVAGVMFFLNRTPGGDSVSGPAQNDCTPPLAGGASAIEAIENEALAAFRASPSLKTYFVVFNNDASDLQPLSFFQQVGSTLPQGAVRTLDATSSDPATVLAHFAQSVTQIATCLYEPPLRTDPNAVLEVHFTNPLAPLGLGDVLVPRASGCDGAHQSAVDGWNLDTGRIRICGASCDHIRQLILTVTSNALQSGQVAPDVPVTATALCSASTPGGTPADASPAADGSPPTDANAPVESGGASDGSGAPADGSGGGGG